MSTTTIEQKNALRRWVRERNRALLADPERRAASDEVLVRRFLALPQVRNAHTILLYASMGAEPETSSLRTTLKSMGKRVLLPRCLSEGRMEYREDLGAEHMIVHRYGMQEPSEHCPLVPLQEIELALVPALCFDEQGYRMGHGGGYYDRFLAQFTGFAVGLCREELLQREVPCEAHDRMVHLVLTEDRTLQGVRC